MIYIIAIISAITWHILNKQLWVATIGSTVTATMVSWVLLSSHFGWFDQTFYKNMALTITASLVISVIVGLLGKFIVIKK